MLDLFVAREKIAQAASALARSETLPLSQARGRILAEDCLALVDVPPAANSAMDGYALVAPSSPPPCTLPISQIIAAGTPPKPLEQGTAARIFTGAEIPPGANAVVIQEDCDATAETVTVRVAVKPSENIRQQGQDLQRGQLVAKKGERLTAVHLGLLASCGISVVTVAAKPRIALLSTGSELIEPGQTLAPGQIYNSNQFMLAALLEDWGCEVVFKGRVEDDLEKTRRLLSEWAEAVDLIVTSGGVSVGDADHLKAAISSTGELNLWKVRLKPGKPLAFGHIHHTARKTPVIALPGNPVSSFVTAALFIKPFIAGLCGQPYRPLEFRPQVSGFSIDRPNKRPELIRVKWENGKLQRFSNQSSGVLSSVVWADGLAWIEADICVRAGDTVPYIAMSDLLSL